MAIGPRIKQARLMQGLSQRELADRLPVSDTTVSKYEREESLPDSAKLMGIAEALGVDLSYFLRAPRVESIRPAYRKLASMGKKEETALRERIRDWLERYLEIESILEFDGGEFAWPEGFPRPVGSMEEVEEAALDLRQEWQIGLDPIEDLVSRLEDHRLRVGRIAGPATFDACAFLADVNGGLPVIVFNAHPPGDRQRFSMAHELGHLMLEIGEEIEEEKACNRFSGAFLVPRPAFLDDVGVNRRHVGIDELALLKEKYGMSMQALVYRMKDLGVLSVTQYKHWFKQFRSRGLHEREPGEPVPRECPRRFRRMVMRARAEELISERRAAELLGGEQAIAPETTSA